MDKFTTFVAVVAVVLVLAVVVASILFFGGYGLFISAFLAAGVLLPSSDMDSKKTA